MTKIDRIYLDSNLLVDFFIRQMRKRKPFIQPDIIEFLSEHKQIPKYISLFSVAEIVAVLKSQFPEFDRQTLTILLGTLHDLTGLKIISVDFAFSWENLVQYTFLCKDAKDSVHVEMARNKDLWIVTRDTNVPRVKPIYPKVIGERKFKRQF